MPTAPILTRQWFYFQILSTSRQVYWTVCLRLFPITPRSSVVWKLFGVIGHSLPAAVHLSLSMRFWALWHWQVVGGSTGGDVKMKRWKAGPVPSQLSPTTLPSNQTFQSRKRQLVLLIVHRHRRKLVPPQSTPYAPGTPSGVSAVRSVDYSREDEDGKRFRLLQSFSSTRCLLPLARTREVS